MIIWFNCKITDVRLNPNVIPRYNLRNDNRYDIAKYSFASYAPLLPLTTKFIFNLELADAFAGREADMQAWLESIFPADRLSIHWYRANTKEQWQAVKDEMDQLDDDLVFPMGNEDHIFMDSSIEIMSRGLDLLLADPDPFAVIGTSHYPESIRASYLGHGALTECKSYLVWNFPCNDAIRIMKKEFLQYYITNFPVTTGPVFRTENWNSVMLPDNTMYTPIKEQFRHFDGYHHVGINAETAPPLEIPPGFFESAIIVRYGFDDNDANSININPLAKNLYAADINGADYKFTLQDMPLFWLPYIKEILSADNIDHQAMAEARDRYYIDLARVHFNWPHFNLRFDDSNQIPYDWISPVMMVTEFAEVD